MSIKVAINGFGRIGRLLTRVLLKDPNRFNLVALNDLGRREDLANLLRFDSVQGGYQGDVDVRDDGISVDGKVIKVFGEHNPSKLPWGELGVDVVVESTGIFTNRKTDEKAGYDSHIDAGAKRVVLSAPAI